MPPVMSRDDGAEGDQELWNYFSRRSPRLRRKRGVSSCLYFSVLRVRGRSWVAKANLDPCVRAIPLAAVPRRFPARGDPATHLYVMPSSKCVLPVNRMMPRVSFLLLTTLLGILGILCVVFTVYWTQHWLGGFAWDGSSKMFNWHPVFMVTGMLVLTGAAVLVYRVPLSWSGPKLPWKLLHAGLTLAAFILIVLGLVAVFEYHNKQGIANMYSLHSWLGLGAVLLFSCQWAMGFASFLLPWAPTWFRALYKPIHVFFGSAILPLVVAACISGINEKLFFKLTNTTTPYSQLPAEAWFANILGMLILVFGLLVLFALAMPAWKRPDVNFQDTQEPLLQEDK